MAPGAGTVEIEAAVERVRAGLEAVSVQFGDSERLPVSVSVGIGAYPEHGASVTELLSAAAVAVGEAKASGGDHVRVARVGEEDRVVSGSFDILQGLVIAVDTKDRYTKRHSEDVARYAVFLAQRLNFDDELQRTIELAGLLHDIGKIGIPDVILRKPSKLTADEYGMFQQHVALGDAIVRDVPNVDLVRAGIRHHHERWDGNGYLEGLEGEGIPLIGRVLAVADAFSAMTTTRPYRKALPIEEALKRLGDAAGNHSRRSWSRRSSPASRRPSMRRCRATTAPRSGGRSYGSHDPGASHGSRDRPRSTAGVHRGGAGERGAALVARGVAARRRHGDADDLQPHRREPAPRTDPMRGGRRADELRCRRRGSGRRAGQLVGRDAAGQPRHRPRDERWRRARAARECRLRDHRHRDEWRIAGVERTLLRRPGLR